MKARSIAVIVMTVAVVIAFVFYEFTFSVAQNQLALKLSANSEVAGTSYEPGLHFKVPLVERIHIFDKRIVTRSYAEDRFMTSDGNTLRVDGFVKWQIADAGAYYKATNGDEDVIAQRLGESIKNAIKEMVAKRTLQQAVAADRNEYMTELFNVVAINTASLGVRLLDVRIRKVSLPESYNDAVYAGMRNGFKNRAAQVRAQGEASAQEITARANRDRIEILANADRDAAITRGDGDAKAAAIYGTAYRANTEFYFFYRSLQAYRASIGRSDNVLVVSPDSDFFKYFNKPAAH